VILDVVYDLYQVPAGNSYTNTGIPVM